MKFVYWPVLLTIFLTINDFCLAQKISVEINNGCDFKATNTLIGERYVDPHYIYSQTPGMPGTAVTYTVKDVKGSFGAGYNFGVQASYKVANHFYVNLGLNSLLGHKYIVTDEEGVGSITGDDTIMAKLIRINTGLMFVINEKKRVQFYAKADVLFPIVNSLIFRTAVGYYISYDQQITRIEITKYSALNPGASLTFGSQVRLSKKLFLTGDVHGIIQQYGYNNGKVVQYDVNGSNDKSSLSVYESQFIYKDGLPANTNYNSPQVRLKEYYPFYSIGFKIGLKCLL